MSSAVDSVRDKVLTKPREPEDWLKADEVEEVAPNEEEMMCASGRRASQRAIPAETVQQGDWRDDATDTAEEL